VITGRPAIPLPASTGPPPETAQHQCSRAPSNSSAPPSPT
jgi:hypothetical protein